MGTILKVKEWIVKGYNFFNGYKTQAVAASGLVALAVGWAQGALNDKEVIEKAIPLLLVITGRDALKKLEVPK